MAYRVFDGSETPDDLILRAWRLRLRHVALEDDMDETEDLAAFTRTIRSPDGVFSAEQSASGRLSGMVLFRHLKARADGRTVDVICPVFFFLDRGQRGGTWLAYAFLAALWRMRGSVSLRNLWAGCVTYLPGFLSMSAQIGSVHLVGPDTPPFERKLLDAVGVALAGVRYDPERGLARLPTRPRDAANRIPSRRWLQLARDRYLERNPTWMSGYGAVAVGRITLASLAAAVSRSFIHRRLRTRTSGAGIPLSPVT